MPRKTHSQESEPASTKRLPRSAFKEEIQDKLEVLDIPPGKRVHLWVEDEHRYGLISTVRRCWTLRGHRGHAPVHQKYEWGYVYGATDLVSGQAQFLYLLTVSLDMTALFLKQLVDTDPEAIHVLLWDRAGFHPKVDLHALPVPVRLVEFPAYSPELNPIEKLWDMVKDAVSNEVWETLSDIESAISHELRPFWESVSRVREFLGDNWLTQAVSSFLQGREDALI